MTLAVAEWLMTDPEHREATLVACMQRLGRKYPHAGYGGMFRRWLVNDHPLPYNSFGNGSAMRVSPVGLYANSLEESLELARITASVTHNHPEGIRGAQAIAACIYMKKSGDWCVHNEMQSFISKWMDYNLDFDLEKMGVGPKPNGTCQRDIPIAIRAYLRRSGYPAQKVLWWVMSMGEDFADSGALAATIASVNRRGVLH